MKRFNIYAHTDEQSVFYGDGDLTTVAVLSVDPADNGKWVEYSEVEEEARLMQLKYQTMENDRDAEKSMKGMARMQRDKMTKKYTELVKLLETTGVLQLDQEWSVEIQNLIKEHKKR